MKKITFEIGEEIKIENGENMTAKDAIDIMVLCTALLKKSKQDNEELKDLDINDIYKLVDAASDEIIKG